MSYSNTKDYALKVGGSIATTGEVFRIDRRGENRMFDTYAVQVKGTGAAPTALTAALEISLDGVNFTSIQALAQTDDGVIKFVVGKLAQCVRVNVSALTLGVTCTDVVFQLIAS